MAWYRCGMNGTYRATTVSRSGAVCNYVANVGGVPLSRFIANITPVQAGSGDPSPSNPRAITGWSAVNVTRTGKNFLHLTSSPITVQGVTFKETENGITITGSPSTSTFTTIFEGMLPLGNCTICDFVAGSNSTHQLVLRKNGTTMASITADAYTFSVANNEDVYSVRLYVYSGNTHNLIKPQLQTGSTTTAYQPYTGQTATINLGGTYYGGYLNVTTGLLTVTWGIEDLGDLTWSYSSGAMISGILTILGSVGSVGSSDPVICSHYATKATRNWAATYNDGECGLSVDGRQIVVKDSNYTDPTAFKTAMANNNVKIVYELATPQTYQLTPAQLTQLLGENNVWADSGDSEVDFFRMIRT